MNAALGWGAERQVWCSKPAVVHNEGNVCRCKTGTGLCLPTSIETDDFPEIVTPRVTIHNGTILTRVERILNGDCCHCCSLEFSVAGLTCDLETKLFKPEK